MELLLLFRLFPLALRLTVQSFYYESVLMYTYTFAKLIFFFSVTQERLDYTRKFMASPPAARPQYACSRLYVLLD